MAESPEVDFTEVAYSWQANSDMNCASHIVSGGHRDPDQLTDELYITQTHGWWKRQGPWLPSPERQGLSGPHCHLTRSVGQIASSWFWFQDSGSKEPKWNTVEHKEAPFLFSPTSNTCPTLPWMAKGPFSKAGANQWSNQSRQLFFTEYDIPGVSIVSEARIYQHHVDWLYVVCVWMQVYFVHQRVGYTVIVCASISSLTELSAWVTCTGNRLHCLARDASGLWFNSDPNPTHS